LKNLKSIPTLQQIPFSLFFIIFPLLVFDLWQEWKQTERPTFFISTKPYFVSAILVFCFFWFSIVSPFGKEDFFYFQF
jgi:hypothetical protein